MTSTRRTRVRAGSDRRRRIATSWRFPISRRRSMRSWTRACPDLRYRSRSHSMTAARRTTRRLRTGSRQWGCADTASSRPISSGSAGS
jgi:hypothetical protein